MNSIFSRRSFFLVSALVLVYVLFLANSGCKKKETAEGPNPSPTMELVIPVKVDKAVHKPVDIRLDIVGSFEAIQEVTLAPQVSGIVQDVTVQIGDTVSTGQLLVQLDSTDYRLQVAQDRANLEEERTRLRTLDKNNDNIRDEDEPTVKKARAIMDNAMVNWQRNINLRKQDLISDKEVLDSYRDYLTSKADYESAIQSVETTKGSVWSRKATLDISTQKLAYTTVTSPLNGSVKDRKVHPGDLLSAGTTALILVQDDPLFLSVDIPQNFIEQITLGKNIVLKTDAARGLSFTGKIVHISPVVNVDTRTVTVKAQINNSKRLLKPGMFGKVTLITGVDKDAILVPKTALYEEMGETKMFLIKKDGDSLRAHQIKVKKGEDQGDWISVKGDVHDGDMVAVSSLASLVENVKVELENNKKPENKKVPNLLESSSPR